MLLSEKNAADKLWSSIDAIINRDASRILGETMVRTHLGVAWALAAEDWCHDKIFGAVLHRNENSGTYDTLLVVNWKFWLTGGYDQEFLPMGCQDADFPKRLTVLGAMLFIESSRFVGADLPNGAGGTLVVAPEVSHLRWGADGRAQSAGLVPDNSPSEATSARQRRRLRIPRSCPPCHSGS